MLTSLKFCQGAVGDDTVPGMNCFVIERGRIYASNGVVTMSAPIDVDFDCRPNAKMMVEGISKCKDETSITLLKSGKISIKSGKFKVAVPTVKEGYSVYHPAGQYYQFDGERLLSGLKTLLPFVGKDVKQLWSTGISLRDGVLAATDNHVLCEYWLGVSLPEPVIIPGKSVREIVRIKDTPIALQTDGLSITIHYEGERWIRTQVVGDKFVDTNRVFPQQSSAIQLPEDFFEGMSTIKPFIVKDTVWLADKCLKTSTTQGDGASYRVGLDGFACMGFKYLNELKDVAKLIDFTQAPKIVFFGDNLRGVLMGKRG